jgi:hypothetical protein
MGRWLAGAVMVTTALVTPAMAQSQAGSFTLLPTDNWAYRAVQRLERQGYFTGSPEHSFDGGRKLTRYEFAVAVERMYRNLQPRVLRATEPGTLRQEVDDFRSLIKEFRAEIGELGPDVTEIQQQVQVLDERLVRLERNAAAAAAAGSSVPDAFPDGRRSIFRGRAAGLHGALQHSLSQDAPQGLLTGFTHASMASGQFGAAGVGLEVRGADPLHQGGGPRFGAGSAVEGYRAEVSTPFAGSRISAFFLKEGSNVDPYGITRPSLGAGPVRGMGGSITRKISDGLEFQLTAATLRALNDETRYVKGGVHYELTRRLTLLLGYEWTRTLGVNAEDADAMAYILGIGGNLSRTTRLDLFYRRPDQGHGGATSGDANNPSAITQISVRF